MNIAPSLDALAVQIDSVHPHPRNPRIGDVDFVMASLSRFGQLRPILVNGQGEIVAGKHTWQAARELGATHIAAVSVDLDEEETLAYLVVDNAASDRATYDDQGLADVLQELSDKGKISDLPQLADDLDDVLARLEQINETEPEEFKGGSSETDEETKQRAARAGGSSAALRTFMLAYTKEEAETFMACIKTLSARYSSTGVIETVYEAVQRQAAVPEEVASA